VSDAHEQIRNLLGRYCELMDAGHFAGLAELFAHATLADEHGNVFATGAEEVHRMWHAQTHLYSSGRAGHDPASGRAGHDDGSPRTKHITANPVIDVDDADGIAQVSSSYVVFQATDDLPLQPIITGRYYDTFTRGHDGAWHWTQRRFAVDHVGDLSHHLRSG
jgi:3-phenylpropionate/cinnamic acid dioxygenase small subunit